MKRILKSIGMMTPGQKLIDTLCELMKRVNMKDLVGGIVVTYGMYLIGKGINHIVSGLVISIVTYYFSKRIYEEKHKK